MKKHSLLTSLLVCLLAACQLPQDNPVPAGKPGALYTEAAQTLSVKMTAEGISLLGTSQTPNPDLADGTPGPDPSSTAAQILSYTPDGSSQTTAQTCDQVRFVKDVTIPDEMDLAPGDPFTKIWRLQNAGSCPWTIGYLLYFENGDLMGGPTSKELTSQTIQPGDTIDVSLDLVAPLETGTYQGNWKLRNVKGDGFGIGEFNKPFWVVINVVEGAGMMLDFNAKAEAAAWGSGTTPVDFIDLGSKILSFDDPGDSGDPYVGLLDQQLLEGGRTSGILLATYPAQGKGKYIIGRYPDYKVNAGDLLFGRVGLTAKPNGNCGDGNVDFRIHLMREGDPASMVMLGEWNEVCDDQMRSFEIDLDDYKGETVQVFLVVVANSSSLENMAVWDSLSVHR